MSAYEKIYANLEAHGLKPKLNMMDNEVSMTVNKLIFKYSTKYCPVDSHNH